MALLGLFGIAQQGGHGAVTELALVDDVDIATGAHGFDGGSIDQVMLAFDACIVYGNRGPRRP